MTNDEFIALTTEAGFEEGWVEVCKVRAELTRLIELAAAKEREACAQVAELAPWVEGCHVPSNRTIAAAIRARSK